MKNFLIIVSAMLFLATSACVSTKKFEALQRDLNAANTQLGTAEFQRSKIKTDLDKCERDKLGLEGELNTLRSSLQLIKEQNTDLKTQRDKQVSQVGDLTVLSQTASNNINETLQQLERKDKYIQLLNAAKSRADSINLALAVNLKSVLRDGLDDNDVEVKVDKTVVFINLSDKMLYTSGSADITPRAKEVLGKIAQIIQSRPDLEVMVEGYTDNVPVKSVCLDDNWDLSVKRATSVVRVLQKDYNIDPNRLIAAGRGEYNALASNDTAEGRSTNRRTRIIILPKLGQFYDLLNPNNAPK